MPGQYSAATTRRLPRSCFRVVLATCRNSSDSSAERRMYSPNRPSAEPSTNTSRQPKLSICAGVSSCVSKEPASEADSVPRPTLM